MGDARTWKPNINIPIVGSAVLFENHVALVIGIIGNHIVLAESNYNLDRRIDIGRTVPINSSSIRGYYLPPVVALESRP